MTISHSRTQSLARDAIALQSELRFRRVKTAARDGASFKEALRMVKMQPGGLKKLLHKKTGSTLWPPADNDN